MIRFAEYIWLDGAEPTQQLRSKTRVISSDSMPKPEDLPEWGFDGSSTNQAPGNKSDLALKPVYCVADPIRGEGHILVMCEVYTPDGQPHATNARALLREVLAAGADKLEPWAGFEQEYTLFKDGEPLAWNAGEPGRPQGPYYCGVGSSQIMGREIVEEHAKACMDIGLNIYGINAEVMPGQWEYQVGYRGFPNDKNDVLTLCDQRYIANWLLQRIAEDWSVDVSFENKPKKGDWNGAGCHTNFSTKDMRSPATGKQVIEKSIALLEKNHAKHVMVYGAALEDRLTGKHETCSVYEFRSGVSDRGASIRLPLSVGQKGYGYIEDRRPGANADPYIVVARILATICEYPQFDAKFEPFASKTLKI